jgi:Hypothetical glycosyl hydrolase family 13/Tetratricopeptide repeat
MDNHSRNVVFIMMLKRILNTKLLRLLMIALALSALAWTAVAFAGDEEAAQIYLRGLNLFYDAKHQGACVAFQLLIDKYPGRPETRDAIYKIAESHYRRDEWEKAGAFYRLYMERFPLSANARDAEKRLAQCENWHGAQIRAAHPLSLYPPLRHVAVISESLPYGDMADLRRGFSALAGENFNTIIIWGTRPVQASIHRPVRSATTQQGAYFKTNQIPVIDADLVENASRVAHGFGMRLLVMIPVRDGPWMLDAQQLMDRKWSHASNEYNESTLLDPFNPEAMQVIEALAADLAATSIDGIILTGRLDLRPEEGMSAKALEAYSIVMGSEAKPEKFFQKDEKGEMRFSEPFAQYALFKTRHMNGLVKKIKEKIKAANPAMQVFAELDPLALIDPAQALSRRSQDAKALFETGVDGIFVRYDWRRDDPAFGQSVTMRLDALARMSKEAAAINSDGRRWIFALPTEEAVGRRFLPQWEITKALANLRGGNAVGFALFPLSKTFPYDRYLMPKTGSAPSTGSVIAH